MPDDPKHLVRTSALKAEDATRLRHPLNPKSEVHLHSLGDRVGMQRCQLKLARLPPGKESFLPHAHALEEEFIYILEGEGRALIGEVEVAVGPGDYMGFPTDGVVHHLRNDGPADLVYLVGGERLAMDVSRFPTIGKRGVFDGKSATFYDEASGQTLPFSAWRPADKD